MSLLFSAKAPWIPRKEGLGDGRQHLLSIVTFPSPSASCPSLCTWGQSAVWGQSHSLFLSLGCCMGDTADTCDIYCAGDRAGKDSPVTSMVPTTGRAGQLLPPRERLRDKAFEYCQRLVEQSSLRESGRGPSWEPCCCCSPKYSWFSACLGWDLTPWNPQLGSQG